VVYHPFFFIECGVISGEKEVMDFKTIGDMDVDDEPTGMYLRRVLESITSFSGTVLL
jgi:hypothetical protein